MNNPPQDIQAESALLGCVLLDNSVMDDLELDADDFFVGIHRRIFTIMLQDRGAGRPTDTVTLYKDINDGVFLSSLLNKVPMAANFQAYAQRIKDKAIMRKILVVGQRMVNASSLDESPRVVLDEFEELVLAIGDNERSSDFIGIQENMSKHLLALEKAVREDEKPGLMTGFKGIDRKLNGLHGGDLIVLAARPGMGKTTLAMNILCNVAEEGYAAGFLSLEMNEESLRARMICSRAQVDSSKVRGAELSSSEMDAYIHAAQQMYKLKIFISDDPRTTLLRLKSSARRLKRQQNIKLLVVDYLQLMTSGEEGISRQGRTPEVSHISRQMKLLAKALNIPILLLSQLNRSSDKDKKRKPRLSDLRDSGAIEQDADVVAFIYLDDDESSDAEVITAKNRAGSTGTEKLQFEKIFNVFNERGE